MGWSRLDYIKKAFAKLGLAAYVYDLTDDQLNDAARDLDAMMAGWNANGIRVGWPIAQDPNNIDLNTDTKTTDIANEAIYLGLAIRIAGDYGKQISPTISQLAEAAYSNLLNQALAPVPQMQLPNTLPRGAGNKPWRYQNGNPFVRKPADNLDVGGDNELILE